MITLRHYLDYTRSSELYNKHIQEIREYNRALIERYPWLKIKNYADFNPYSEKEPTDEYNWTWLDDMGGGLPLASKCALKFKQNLNGSIMLMNIKFFKLKKNMEVFVGITVLYQQIVMFLTLLTNMKI